MFDTIKVSLLSIIIFLLIISCLWFLYKSNSLESKLSTCQTNIIEQNTAIDIMKQQADAQLLQQKQKEIQALKESSASKKRAENTMAIAIPKECDKDAQWAVNEAIKMRQQ